MIRGRVDINLRYDPFDTDRAEDLASDRRKLAVLEHCPDGVRVLIDIGSRKYLTNDAVAWVHAHQHRLEIEICGARPEVVARFVRASRSGEWIDVMGVDRGDAA